MSEEEGGICTACEEWGYDLDGAGVCSTCQAFAKLRAENKRLREALGQIHSEYIIAVKEQYCALVPGLKVADEIAVATLQVKR